MGRKPHHSKNWGGKREGGGRPRNLREQWSDQELRKMRKAFSDAAKKHGKNVWDVMAEYVFEGDKRAGAQAAAMFKDAVLVRETKQHREITVHAPVALPVMEADPGRLDESADPVPHSIN